MTLAAIEGVLESYFDALYHSDAGLMQQVMHPACVYATADEAPAVVRSVPEYLEVLRHRHSPASRGEVRADQVLAIDLAGENTAVARVRCSIGERNFTDYLSLIRVEGQWRIIAKVFAVNPPSKEN